jgi:hypothetical protein
LGLVNRFGRDSMKRRFFVLYTAAAVVLVALPAMASASVSASPQTLAFSELKVGAESPSQEVTVVVSCQMFSMMATCMTGDTFTPNPTFGGSNPGDFKQTNNCGTSISNSGVVPGLCRFNITFKPTGPGPRKATLTLGTSASGSGPPQIVMTGSATGDPIAPGKKRCKKAKKKRAAAAKKKKCKKKGGKGK